MPVIPCCLLLNVAVVLVVSVIEVPELPKMVNYLSGNDHSYAGINGRSKAPPRQPQKCIDPALASEQVAWLKPCDFVCAQKYAHDEAIHMATKKV